MNEGVRNEYFRNLNPLAQRIAEDIDKVRESYKDKWECLTYKEKNQRMDNALVEADFKHLSHKKKEIQLEPLSKFSWFSKSQLDLFQCIDVKPKLELISPARTNESKTEPPRPKTKPKVAKSPSSDDKLSEPKKSHVAKPKMPPPPPPKKVNKLSTKPKVDDDDDDEDIPKTGFDFLDNW